jgi:hypothetical protein
MSYIKGNKFNNTSTLSIVSLLALTVLFSSNSLAKLKPIEQINSQEGYPYAGLIQRSELVNLIYTESKDEVNCRVEITNNGQVWKGTQQVAKLKNFKSKPLHSCLPRAAAKKLLASTY